MSGSVLHVMGWSSQQYGSFERFLVGLAERSAAAGLESHFAFHRAPRSSAFVTDAQAQMHVLEPARAPVDPRFAAGLGRLIKDTRATHVHAHFGLDAYLALAGARRHGVAARFMTKHITPSATRRSLSRARHRWLAAQVQRLLAVSAHVADRLRALGVPGERLEVCRLGVDAAAYRPDEQRRRAARAALGLRPGDVVLLSTSHLRPGKGVEVLPRLAGALGDVPGARVLVAGDGPLRPQLEHDAERLGLARDRFRLLGVREDVPELLSAADVFVFATSADEGLPLGPLEAVAAGVALVASAVSDLPLLVGPGAELQAPGDFDALIEACRRLVLDPGRRRSLAALGPKLAEERFSVATAVARHVELYTRGAAGPAGTR